MNALEFLRLQLLKDYPGDHPAFGKTDVTSEQAKSIFDALIIPVFEKIKAEFDPFHFQVGITHHIFSARLNIKDKCSYFFCSAKINRSRAFLSLRMSYAAHSLRSNLPQERVLYEERFDLPSIHQNLPEEMIVGVFSDTFINRKMYLKKMLEAEENEERERQLVIQERLRSRLVALRLYNQERDPEDRFRGRIDRPEARFFLRLFRDVFGDNDTFIDEWIFENEEVFNDNDEDY